jgi:hypothetical protein
MRDTTEYETRINPSNVDPLIQGGLYPVRDRDRADMTTLTEQVNDGPVIVSLLKVRQLQTDQLGTPEATAQQECQDGMISFAFCALLVRASRSLRPCAQVSQFPSRVPSFFTPFTRLMVAARSGLSKPLSEAS